MFRVLKWFASEITFERVLITIVVLPTFIYLYQEVNNDALIIDPFSVPKAFEEAGLSAEVMGIRVSDALRQIEQNTQSGDMKKDRLMSLRDETAAPDVEIPGAKLGLKTIVQVLRAIFEIYPKHISGDIIVPANFRTAPEQRAKVTVYLTQGRNRSLVTTLNVSGENIGDVLAERTAEKILERVNPFVFAIYSADHKEYEKAAGAIQEILQNPSSEVRHKAFSLLLWGDILLDQGKEDEALLKYQRAIELDPKDPLPYDRWGEILQHQKKYEEAILKYRKAIELEPEDGYSYYRWGSALQDQKNYAEAIEKYRKAIEINPKESARYARWGMVLSAEKKYEDAVLKFQKALEVDPKDPRVYVEWGNSLLEQKKLDGAVVKFQKAIELDPKNASAYFKWSVVLQEQGKAAEAAVKLDQAKQLGYTQ